MRPSNTNALAEHIVGEHIGHRDHHRSRSSHFIFSLLMFMAFVTCSLIFGYWESAVSFAFIFPVLLVHTWVRAIITGYVTFISFLLLTFSEVVMWSRKCVNGECFSFLVLVFHGLETGQE